jgi:hypothetical protein
MGARSQAHRGSVCGPTLPRREPWSPSLSRHPPGRRQTPQAQQRLERLTLQVLDRFAGGHQQQHHHHHPSHHPDAAPHPPSSELGAFAPLVVSALRALAAAGDPVFRRQLPRLFPLLARLVQCDHATPDVQRALSDLLLGRVGPLLATAADAAGRGGGGGGGANGGLLAAASGV